MSQRRNIIRSLLALAGVAAGLSSAQAATVVAPAAGDLFLGFRASGGQGASTSYILNIGSDLTYRNAPAGTSFDVPGLGGIGADLGSVYGPSWFSRDDLYWGIFGVRSSVNSTVYGSREQAPAGTPSPAWPSLTQTARNGTAGALTDVIEGLGGYLGSESTANSTVAILQSNSSAASSYNEHVATAGTTDFGSLSQWASIEGNFGAGTAGTSLDLYRLAGTGVTRVGDFTLNNSGGLHFTAPVPEPGSSLLLAAAGATRFARRRRIHARINA